LVLGVLVIIAFSIYTFGSYSTKPKGGTKVEPVKNAVTTNNSNADHVNSTFTKNTIGISKSISPSSNSFSPSSIPMSIFENREKIENFYSIQFPSSSTVLHGNESGSYAAKFSRIIFSVGLIDIPDNSNINIYAITQLKPTLQASMKNFNLIGFKQLNLGGQRAWELIYTWRNSTQNMESVKTLVEGSDNAAAITFSWPEQQYTHQIINYTIVKPILASFHWTPK
jgi:hypothetical protein